jgi:hypothetical protein
MRRSHFISMVIVTLAVSGCGAGESGSGNHSVADVKSAMHAVGLNGFHPISKESIRHDKPRLGIKPNQIDGAFWFVHLGTEGKTASVVTVVVAVVNDRRVIPIMEREVAHDPADMSELHFHHFQADNVVILTGSENVDAAGRRTIARIHKLVAYLQGR